MLVLFMLLFLSLAVARPSGDDVSLDAIKDEAAGVEGPARESPVLPDSEDLPVWRLPMEHRDSMETVLPNIKHVTRNVYEALNVDLFFSMWFVFLNNKVTYSGEHKQYATRLYIYSIMRQG